MFTPEERDALRTELLARARSDPRISGGAITGSASVAGEDRWSDIDLAFGVRASVQIREVLEDFTRYMREARGALEHLDVLRDPWIYRVFLMPSTLQVDLAFAPASHFRARARTFKLEFGEAAEASHIADPDPRELIGYAWLYALHGRSSIARGRRWQAEYMIGLMRDQVLSLACVRLGLPAREGRGTDQLPDEVTRPLEAALIGGLGRADLVRAFAAATEGLLREIRSFDEALATRLTPTLAALVESVEKSSTSAALQSAVDRSARPVVAGVVTRIRPAEPRDARELAEVHVASWQVAYRGQLPDALLDGMSGEVERRTATWEGLIAAAAERGWTQLVCEEDRIVGFATFGRPDAGALDERTAPAADAGTGQLYAIYVHPDHWDHGHGRDLMSAAVEGLAAAGYRDAVLWVLETNARARRFYEIAGWASDGGRKTEHRGDVPLHEIRYRRVLPSAPSRAG